MYGIHETVSYPCVGSINFAALLLFDIRFIAVITFLYVLTHVFVRDLGLWMGIDKAIVLPSCSNVLNN